MVKTLGELLQVHRAKNRWTQEMMAGKLNMSQSKLSRLESGQRGPDWEDVQRISEVLEIPLDELKEITEQDKRKAVKRAAADRAALLRLRAARRA